MDLADQHQRTFSLENDPVCTCGRPMWSTDESRTAFECLVCDAPK